MSNAEAVTQVAEFRTTDLDIAACCHACDITLADMRPVTQGAKSRVEFIFDDSSARCEDIKHKYVYDELLLPARTLLRSLRELKFRLHQM